MKQPTGEVRRGFHKYFYRRVKSHVKQSPAQRRTVLRRRINSSRTAPKNNAAPMMKNSNCDAKPHIVTRFGKMIMMHVPISMPTRSEERRVGKGSGVGRGG